MRRKLAAIAIATVAFAGLGVPTASASTCSGSSVKTTSGDVTRTTSVRQCYLDRGGYSYTTTQKVSTKTPSGTVSDTRTDAYSKTVSKAGNVSERWSVKVCHKDAGVREVCSTSSTTR